MQSMPYARRLGVAVALVAGIAGCGGKSSSSMMSPIAAPMVAAPAVATYEVTMTNLTAGQPLSPLLALAHTGDFTLFGVGQEASAALEKIAEAGDTSALMALIGSAKAVLASAAGPAAPLLPGANNGVKVRLSVPVGSLADARLSLAVMLGNTNDGFAGVAGEPLASIAVNTTRTIELMGYDAGTELNSESADTVPGPATAAAGGKREAFNPARDDVVRTVHVHPGIVGMDDGLPGSALTQAERWDNPVARLTIRRVE